MSEMGLDSGLNGRTKRANFPHNGTDAALSILDKLCGHVIEAVSYQHPL